MAYISFQPKDYFNTKLYTGTGSAPNAQTGVGFKPDLLWIKTRSVGNDNRIHSPQLTASDYFLQTNTANAQSQNTNCVTSFDTDGFTLGNTDAGWNGSGVTFASWNWKANGQGSSNTDGSINTTYTSVNTTSGFSICQYTGNGSVGATVGHGLGAIPKMIIVKNLSATGDWIVYHEAIGNTKRLRLNTTASEETNAFWNDTTPTSSVWSMNDNGDGNGSGSNYIAYCFAEKKGFSKFGSYVGNGNADGSYIHLGFKPAFVIIKGSSNTENWHMYDNKRDTFNPTDQALQPNTTSVEFTETNVLDFLSNGFKLRVSGGGHNGSGVSYIYMAFSEESIVSSNGVPAVAR